MAQAARWQRHRKKCVVCGEMFACHDKRQPCCGGSCEMKRRGPEWRARFIRAGIEARRKKGYTRFVRLLRAMGLSDDDVRRVLTEWQRRYLAGHKAGSERGYRKGWADACDEPVPARGDRRVAQRAAVSEEAWDGRENDAADDRGANRGTDDGARRAGP